MADEHPLFSIVFIARNGARHISRALDAALSQERHDVEYLVLDLNSDDGTPDILQRYQDRLSLCQTLRDGRWADAAQASLVVARGEWVMFLDSRHWLGQGALNAIASAIGQNPEASIVTGGTRIVVENSIGGIDEKRGIAARDIAMSAPNILNEPMLHARAFRRSALLQAGGFELDKLPRLPRMVAQRSALLGLLQKQAVEIALPYDVCSETIVAEKSTRQMGLASLRRLAECQQIMTERFAARFVNTADAAAIRQWMRRQMGILAADSLKHRHYAYGWYFLKRYLGLQTSSTAM